MMTIMIRQRLENEIGHLGSHGGGSQSPRPGQGGQVCLMMAMVVVVWGGEDGAGGDGGDGGENNDNIQFKVIPTGQQHWKPRKLRGSRRVWGDFHGRTYGGQV